MRAHALVLFAALLIAACKSPTGGGPPPPPPPVTPVVTSSNVPASLEAGTPGRATFQVSNVNGCEPSSPLGYLATFQVESCSSTSVVVTFVATTAKVGQDSLVVLLTNTTGGRLRVAYPVEVRVPPVPSGGFVSPPSSVVMGDSVRLHLNVSDETSCTITVSQVTTESNLRPYAANLESFAQGQCPSAVNFRMGIMVAPNWGVWVRIEAQGRPPQGTAFRDSVWIGQEVKELQIDSPTVIRAVNGQFTRVDLRSPNCSFVKYNPGVHLGTEFSTNGSFPDRPIAEVLSPCLASYGISSGWSTPGEYTRYFGHLRPDGRYSVVAIPYIVTNP
jgi:hypothetical protein